MPPRKGTHKIKLLLAQDDIQTGRDRLFSLFSVIKLLVRNRRACHRATNSNPRFCCYPNRVKEGLIPERQSNYGCRYYLPSNAHGSTYLSSVTDAYSSKIMGYHIGNNIKLAWSSRPF